MPHILLVEDNLNNAQMMIRLLETAGYEVRHFDRGLPAMRDARQDRPRMILMDLNLPDIDGTNVVLVLKKQLGGAAAPPILAVSARASDHDRRYALHLGCDAFVSKPIDPVAFIELVNKMLKTGAS